MTLQLRTKARLFDLHCSVGLTDWDMDKELKLATTTDQFYHGDPFCFLCGVGRHCSYEKLNDQYVVQRPSARASRRKDEFIWYDKMSDTFVKPNLWLLVNPDIACPIQYRENASDLRPLCEAADEIHTAVLDPAETHHQLPSDLHIEHFPFFQTAPDGWKNTIRHNLCFNSSFRKTCNQLYRDGKRKSCFWHLTLDGHRRLRDEIRTLTGESFEQLERSMSHPGRGGSSLEHEMPRLPSPQTLPPALPGDPRRSQASRET
ncbi:hypothetical protein L3Q82_000119 [Scortum barcoo]|uniref:Uncharacterized protein n=1 Tax=Scortum barcoo TaxID=214431 RepID=A0ACB8XBG7_9TELE|nr:hypothetical protein L3Q82_000119 [Scortum barcoo]